MLLAFDFFVAEDEEVRYFVVANGADFGVGCEIADCCDLKHDPKNLETMCDRACFAVYSRDRA